MHSIIKSCGDYRKYKTMSASYSLGIILLFSCCVHIQGVQQYGRCSRYNPGEYIDPSRCALCIQEDFDEGFKYCRHYECQPNTCGDRAVKTNMCCASCPGTCNYGGTVYAIGDRFTCLDGVNNCQCIGTGLVRSNKLMYYKEDLCDPFNRRTG